MKKNLSLFLLFFLTINFFAQQEQMTGFLEKALDAVNKKDEKNLSNNLMYFSTAIEEQDITPEKLSEKNLNLYTDILYFSAVNNLRISQGFLKNIVDFLEYNIEKKPKNNYVLGWVYQNSFGVSQDLSKAKYWYQQAANKEDDMGMSALALLYVDLQDYNNSVYWFEKVANNTNKKDLKLQSMLILTQIYKVGIGDVPQDFTKYMYWNEKAIEN